ncbi:MAG TPA: UDP-N-acetylmuramoyl-tripeptide--D-alanyl-D-alanine ligase [Phycisphaerae bacterium]|nr:UDP-N-acetylmuramoyl-tripeptide--D-alanyl-D-alanine ligase [Phycisphaerae bacterium]HRY67043.1 UDP-N-acetylmuramoyl-tripeptide--D-alanyl-D-alanine ligase [Phycisphaerae bacterium]HSA27740.1 UDP-N-acetylmuramoyl-tripeptide--D-alanyl-D-alanine ligase [Phycisphaerae bacterium]
MKPLTLQEVVTAMEGTPDRPVPVGSVSRVSIDSRAVVPGDLFVAIKGLQYDGHDYVGPACTAGAMAAVVRNDYLGPKPRGNAGGANPSAGLLIRVDSPVAALGRLARYYRRSVIGGSVKVVAVTGSNGKTTTKAMIGHVLSSKWQGRAGVKSFNNEIGVPLTLLSTEPSDTFLVCEVGTNAPGEIAALARLIEPEIGVITNVAEVHLQGLGTIEGVAREKLSLLSFLRPDGCAVINADAEVLRTMVLRERQYSAVKKVMFGEWPEAELRLSGLRSVCDGGGGSGGTPCGTEFTVNDRFKYRLNVPGRHNAHNALAVIGVARRFGMEDEEIAVALATFTLPPMRLQYKRFGGLTLINDGYNANPASMAAALSVLLEAGAAGRRVFVVGDMRELGVVSERCHRELADRIGQSPIDLLIAVGENAKLMAKGVKGASAGRIETHAYATTDAARRRLVAFLRRDDTVLVKGSRALALERLVEAMEKWAQRPTVKGKGAAR